MRKALIKSQIGMMSCVGFSGSYPFKRGNYCSNIEHVYFTNIWGENLTHLINLGTLPDGKIEVLLFKDDSGRESYAYVIDERIPKEALHAPYFCGIKTSVEVLKYHHNIDSDTCLHEVDDYKHCQTIAVNNEGNSWMSCPECETVFNIQKPRANGVYRVQIKSDDGWRTGKWALAWYESGFFRNLPLMDVIRPETILKVDTERVSAIPSIKGQQTAIPLEEFTWSGLIDSK